MNIYNLMPYDSHKSFYGKAQIIINNGNRYLKSYSTIMASVDRDGKVHRHSGYSSNTTRRHLIAFWQETNVKMTNKDFYKLEKEDNEIQRQYW